ncbi:hypothetical protein BC835DRAFT_1528590 [Cytidiella melzeri]|nr:hypothetical protein BC835DRAFT_1528590 [Cytidiella melzeri]
MIRVLPERLFLGLGAIVCLTCLTVAACFVIVGRGVVWLNLDVVRSRDQSRDEEARARRVVEDDGVVRLFNPNLELIWPRFRDCTAQRVWHSATHHLRLYKISASHLETLLSANSSDVRAPQTVLQRTMLTTISHRSRAKNSWHPSDVLRTWKSDPNHALKRCEAQSLDTTVRAFEIAADPAMVQSSLPPPTKCAAPLLAFHQGIP